MLTALLIIGIHLFWVTISYFFLRFIVMGIGFNRKDKGSIWLFALFPGFHKDAFKIFFGFGFGVGGAVVHRIIWDSIFEWLNPSSVPAPTITGPITGLIVCMTMLFLICKSGSGVH